MKLQLIKKLVALLCFAAVWGLWILLPATARAALVGGVVAPTPLHPIQTTSRVVMEDTVFFELSEVQPYTVRFWTYMPPEYDTSAWCVYGVYQSGNAPFPPGAVFSPAEVVEGCLGPGDSLFIWMTWTPGYCDSGYYEIKTRVDAYYDGPCPRIGTPLNAGRINAFRVDNANRPPVIDSVTPDSLVRQVGRNVHIQVCAKDLDKQECGDDTLLYSYSSNPAPLITALLSPDGAFDWTPQQSEIGTHNLRFWVTDRSNDSSASQHSIVNVYVCGDLDLNGILTGSDVVLELLAVFLGQEPPAPFPASDLNGDGQRTATDVVLELNAVFLGIVEGNCP